MVEIKVEPKGAELTSILVDGIEMLHDGINDWNRHSTVLFQIVGRLREGKTVIEDSFYEMGQHGFARDMLFEEVEPNTYVLKYNEETLKKYPYKFELMISYKVDGNNVITRYQVKNVDDKDIYFGLGGHPAFKCDYSNATLEFEVEENDLKIYQLENGLVKLEPEDTSKFTDGRKIVFTKDYFKNDAVIMKGLKSNKVTLKENDKKVLTFDFTDFPILAVWSKVGAKFLCIEPWFNTADSVNSSGIFKNKENIIKLEKGKTFEVEYRVEF